MQTYVILTPLPLPALSIDEAIDALQGQIGGDNPLIEEQTVVLQRFANTPFFLLPQHNGIDLEGTHSPAADGQPAAVAAQAESAGEEEADKEGTAAM